MVLKPQVDNKKSLSGLNLTRLARCGANDCPSHGSEAAGAQIQPPELSTVYTLCFIYLILALVSILLIAFFLDTFDKEKKTPQKSGSLFQVDLLLSTIRNLKNLNQILIIPITLWLGFSLAFIGADFTKSFVACAKGVDAVGFAMICFGLTDACGSYVFGLLNKSIGRIACFTIGALLNLSVILLMLFWKVNLEQDYIFYLIPAVWGLADAAWQTQVNSLYGVLFKDNHNAAFSNFRLWESLGFAISYLYSNYLCTSTKLNLLLFYLFIGMIGYYLIELIEAKRISKNSPVVKLFIKMLMCLFILLVLLMFYAFLF